MRSTRLPALLLALAVLPAVSGCPKKDVPLSSEEVLAVDPKANFVEGMRALEPDRRGNIDYEGAYSWFMKSAELNGGAKAHFNAGYVAEKVGKRDKALDHYRKAYAASPEYAPAMFSLARLQKATGDADGAAATYKAWLDAHPDDKEVRSEYMEALVDAGQDAEAIAVGQEVLRKDPNNDAVYRALSGLYLKQGRLEMAQIMGDKALELNDADPDVYNNMGVVYLQQGDEPAAIDKFQMARTLDSQHFEANMNLGSIALNSGDYGLALQCYEAAAGRNPSSLDARLGKAVALRGTGDLDGAGDLYDALIDEDAKLKAAYFNAATLHEKYTRDFDKALKYLESYKDEMAGTLSPSDEVFARIQSVEAAKAAELERKRIEEQKRKEEEERKRRAREALAAMEELVINTQARLDDNAGCLPEMVTMEVGMILGEVASVIEMEDVDMATDVKGMLDDYYIPLLDQAEAENCGAGAGAAEGEDAEGDAPMDEGATEDGSGEESGDEGADDEAADESGDTMDDSGEASEEGAE